MRIAIVEDNADVRAQLCGFVKQYAAESGTPLEVETFPDGSAITPYRGGFDVIFMDIEMPRQGGHGHGGAHPGGGPECGAGLCDQHGPVRHPRL